MYVAYIVDVRSAYFVTLGNSNLNAKLMAPSADIEEILFKPSIDLMALRDFIGEEGDFGSGCFQDIHWLNTPGPIYTTCTDNCGTGQIEAINNVGGDEDYREVIFKQPFTKEELKATAIAGMVDAFGSYYIDGSQYWNEDNVLEWWNKSKERVDYIIDRYNEELNLPEIPHISTWEIGGKSFTGRLYGPVRPVPENYKYWLDFYQQSMKSYLEWYVCKLHGTDIVLPPFIFDWSRKERLDKVFAGRS
ncbi:hypothetical protein [Chitinophaga sp. S165]|uniref:hypothetical protein n=1 Tax=Chitinophaga sp. S165 TaxID=2135462 RepID=UPI0011B4A010|nr:hypothetical protein [Chitinophaga sp. S165]